jgi:hypothetical protein
MRIKKEKDIQKQGQSIFEQIKKNDEHGNEFWTARTCEGVRLQVLGIFSRY